MKRSETLYDPKYDILTFKLKDRDYKMSVELQDFVIDFDTDNSISGIRIFDASKVTGIRDMGDVRIDNFHASVQDKVVTVKLSFSLNKRHFSHQITAQIDAEDSEVSVAG
jgi:hypothetical protein